MLTISMAVYDRDPLCAERTLRALESIERYTSVKHEVILIDNDSPCIRAFGKFSTTLGKSVLLPKNVGFGKAINLAWELKDEKCEWFAQMNSDCLLVEDTFAELIRVAEKHELDVAFPDHTENMELCGVKKADELMQNGWRFGALWLARKESLDRVTSADGHLFDPRFFCYFDDTDLWRRMEQAGMKLDGTRSTAVSHLGGGSGTPEFTAAIFAESKRLYEEKWGIA